METIFDHSPTKAELKDLIYFETPNIDELLNAGFSQNQWYSIIYSLYELRGDKETARKYLNKIPDTADKFFGLMNHDFAI
ncbi:MAG: hypothetical protein IKS94_07385 [Prevotella sp.]|nr:hypothetical protein [Prevotella sp.]